MGLVKASEVRGQRSKIMHEKVELVKVSGQNWSKCLWDEVGLVAPSSGMNRIDQTSCKCRWIGQEYLGDQA